MRSQFINNWSLYIYWLHSAVVSIVTKRRRQWGFQRSENLDYFTVGENVINLFVFDAFGCIVVGTLVRLMLS